ncbi:MAG: DNA glycosylase [Nitrososphaeria archaeon]
MVNELILDLSKYSSFSLDYCFKSGQIFGWRKMDSYWYGPYDDVVLRLSQISDRLKIHASKEISEKEIIHFLGLKDKKKDVDKRLALNLFMRSAISRYSAVRIFRQDPSNTILSYLCAQNKNIPAIERMIFELSRKFGDRVELDGTTFYTFPRFGRIARSNVNELLRVGLGYRAKYLLEASKALKEDVDYINKIKEMSYVNAWNEMVAGNMKLIGVGPKVADCILLYGFEKMEAFPIDVWVSRVYTTAFDKLLPEEESKYYFERLCLKNRLDKGLYLKLANSARKVFGEYAGYAQLYIFMYGRDYLRYCR